MTRYSLGRELLIKGLRFKIGKGYQVRTGLDPWIPGHSEFKPLRFTGDPTTPVSNFILDTMEWNKTLLKETFA